MITISFLLSLTLSWSWAGDGCFDLFKTEPQSLEKAQETLSQMLYWEQKENLTEMIKSLAPFSMEMVAVNSSSVHVDFLPGEQGLVDAFRLPSGEHLWPRHPLNTDSRVPYKADPVHQHWNAFYSASRSLFFEAEGRFYSVKLPTNRPHPRGENQDTKAELQDDLRVSLDRSRLIQREDRRQGESPYLRVLYDVMAMKDRRTGNGWIVRDLSPLMDGHYYLPAFSIPYVGQSIAENLGEKNWQKFWQEHYASALGRAKALLLLRYGLQMETPNPQNILIQLDGKLRPTGRIYLRDMADTFFVDSVAQHLGHGGLVRKDHMKNIAVDKDLEVAADVSVWRMEQGGVRLESMNLWIIEQEAAYVRTIERELGLLKNFYISPKHLQTFLFSSKGRQALQDYYRRNEIQ